VRLNLTHEVSVDRVSVRYGATRALDDVSFDVIDGEIVCLLGPSGSGKSTLLRVVAGIERPTAGRIVLGGVEVAGATQFIEPEQRRVGMVFQDYALFPHLTVAANVAFGLKGRPRSDADPLVSSVLDRLGLSRHAASYPHMLSGGERQRVALARAMAPRPRVLLMDEPFSSLDSRLRDEVRAHTLGLLRDTRTTTIFVTHDPHEAMRIADRIALLQAGRLVQYGPPVDIYLRPTTLFAARFFSDVNELHGTCRNGRIETPLGSFPAPHLANEASACVCIRPEHLRVVGCSEGVCARVVRTAFLGEIDHLEVAVPGLDAPMTLRAFGRTAFKPDDPIHLNVNPSDVLVVARDGRAPAVV
jgi:iron(III) transport system ATP-binding protein